MESETTTCKSCGVETDVLAVFPGGICVACYEKTPEANAPLTADGLAAMFGKASLR